MLRVLPRTARNVRTLWPILSVPWQGFLGTSILGLLLARAAVMGELYPFGIAFLAAVCVIKRKFAKAAFLGVIIGTLLSLQGWPLAGYLLSAGIVYGVLSHFQGHAVHWLLPPSLVFAIHLLLRGASVLIFDNQLYQWVGVVFEAFFTGVLSLVAVNGLQSYPKLLKGYHLSTEERTSLGLMILGTLIGIAQLSIGSLSLQSVISRWVVLWGALLGGPGGGAAIGVAVGLIPSLQGTLTTGSIAFYALAGLLGGIFNSFRKIGVMIGFTLAILMLSLFFTEQETIIQSLQETALACLFFALYSFPIGKVQDKLTNDNQGQENDHNAKQKAIYKLQQMSKVFSELAVVFHDVQEEREKTNDLNILFNKVASQVCESCSLHRVCWEQDFYKTYRALLEACTKLETGGNISEKEFNADLKRRCMRLRELSVALNSQLELLKIIRASEHQLESCRQLVNNQLTGLAKIVESFAEELKIEQKYDQQLALVLEEKLGEKGLRIEGIQVIEMPDREKEIEIRQKICQDRNWCKAMIAPNISQILGKTYVLKSQECFSEGKEGLCTFRLSPSRAMQVAVGKAQCPKEGSQVSGDVCSALHLPNHRFALMISDGMGAGLSALAESTAAIKLLEKLLLADISPETAVKTINAAIYLKSPQERFTTLDLVIINQVNGQTDFIKIGGAPSFIRSSKGCNVINASAPPVGILGEVEVKTLRHVLLPGQFLIMMSDGVWEALHQVDGPVGWLEDLLLQSNINDPQQLANYLLFLAKKATGCAKDDLTVQVARIDQREIA